METSERTSLLLGQAALDKLKDAWVLVVGVGGVGGMAAEALARTGVGHLVLIDRDVTEASNRNRQLVALSSTIGRRKTELMKARILDINPECDVIDIFGFYDHDMDEVLDRYPLNFVLDCIDSLKAKEDLIQYCISRHIPFLCSMGMARRKNPQALEVMELLKTSYDPMAKRLRSFKRKAGIKEPVWTVCSREPAGPVAQGSPLPSAMFVPASAGLLMADTAVKTLIGERK